MKNKNLPESHENSDLRTRFQCKRCGKCCSWKGFVRVTEEEINGIADYLNIPLERFLEDYTRLLPDRSGLSLLDKETGECFYYDPHKGCMIQAVKPKQCREFPFTWQIPGWDDICEGGKALKN
jgi:Fe-S-cluster containining protein